MAEERKKITARRIAWIVFSSLIIFCSAAIILASVSIFIAGSLNTVNNSASNSIIGGADGAIAEYLIKRLCNNNSIAGQLLRFGALVAVTGIVFLAFNKFFAKHCEILTSLTSFALSVIIGSGLGCIAIFATCYFLTHPDKHPVRHPASFILGVICFFAMMIALLVYALLRIKNPSVKGIIIDVALTIIYAAPMWTFFLLFVDVGSEIIKRLGVL